MSGLTEESLLTLAELPKFWRIDIGVVQWVITAVKIWVCQKFDELIANVLCRYVQPTHNAGWA